MPFLLQKYLCMLFNFWHAYHAQFWTTPKGTPANTWHLAHKRSLETWFSPHWFAKVESLANFAFMYQLTSEPDKRNWGNSLSVDFSKISAGSHCCQVYLHHTQYTYYICFTVTLLDVFNLLPYQCNFYLLEWKSSRNIKITK